MASTVPSTRDTALDVVRGICLILIVERHAALLTVQGVWSGGVGLPLDGWITAIGQIMYPVRSPAMMFLAAIFARVGLEKLGTTNFLRRKVVRAGYPAVVWLLLFALARAANPFAHGTSPAEVFFSEMLVPTQTVWFIQQLVFFFVLYAALGRWIIVPGLIAGVIVLFDLTSDTEVRRLCYMLHFFALGTLVTPRNVSALVSASTPRLLAVAIPLLVGASALALPISVRYSGTSLPVSYAALIFLPAFGAVLARAPALARPVAALGEKPLEVYLLHWPLQLALCAILIHMPWMNSGRVLYVALLAIGLGGSLAMTRVFGPWGLNLLFEPPKRRLAPAPT